MRHEIAQTTALRMVRPSSRGGRSVVCEPPTNYTLRKDTYGKDDDGDVDDDDDDDDNIINYIFDG